MEREKQKHPAAHNLASEHAKTDIIAWGSSNSHKTNNTSNVKLTNLPTVRGTATHTHMHAQPATHALPPNKYTHTH